MSDPRNEIAVSRAALQRLIEVKAREADARLAAELASRRRGIEYRETLAAKIGRLTDTFELGRLLLREAQEVLGATHAIMATVGEDQFLEVLATTEALPPRYRTELMEEAFIVGEPLYVAAGEDGLSAVGNADMPPGVHLRALPFSRKDGAPLGVLVLEGALGPEGEQLLPGFLALVAEGLEDCAAYMRLEGLIIDAALAISRVHDARTPGEFGQAARVEALSTQLAQALGLGESQCKRVRLIALLHGLTAEQVAAGFHALRRGQATAALWAETLATPFVGGIYASPLADFQALLGELRYLHARWDGQDNDPPARGDELPLAARIVAVAAAFAELTDGLCRRAALSVREAVAELSQQAGGRFDPVVVRALAEVFRELQAERRIERA